MLLLGRRPERLTQFSPSLDSRHIDVIDSIRTWAPQGVSVVSQSSGSTAFLESLYPVLKRGAQLVSASFVGTEGLMDVQKMRDKELSLHAVSGWTRERVNRTLEWLAEGKLETLSLITHHFKASECAAAYDLILRNPEPQLGVVLDW